MAATLVLIGGGKMGAALIGGLLNSGAHAADALAVVETSPNRRDELAAMFPELAVHAQLSGEVVAPGGGAIVAVKPDQAESVALLLGGLGIERILSIAAGISTQRLQSKAGPSCRVVRAMPNTAALVGKGMAAISGSDAATAADLDWAERILGAVGTVVRIPERQMDGLTAVSGSGPAYLFLVAEAMIDAAVSVGLTRDQATTLVTETFVGAATLLAETGHSAVDLRAEVTSPAGVTAAGLRILEMKGVRSAFIEAIQTAAERSFQLGRA